jgi:hypothetical protein
MSVVNEPLGWQLVEVMYLAALAATTVIDFTLEAEKKDRAVVVGFTWLFKGLVFAFHVIVFIMAIVYVSELETLPTVPVLSDLPNANVRWMFSTYVIFFFFYCLWNSARHFQTNATFDYKGVKDNTTNNTVQKHAHTYGEHETDIGQTQSDSKYGPGSATLMKNNRPMFFILSIGGLFAWYGFALLYQLGGWHSYEGKPDVTAVGWINLSTCIYLLVVFFIYLFQKFGRRNLMFVHRGKVWKTGTTGAHVYCLLPVPMLIAMTLLNCSFWITFFDDYGRFPVAVIATVIFPWVMAEKTGSYGVVLDYMLMGFIALYTIYFFPTLAHGMNGYDQVLDGIPDGQYRWYHFMKDSNNTNLKFTFTDTAFIQYSFSIGALLVSTVGWAVYYATYVYLKGDTKEMRNVFNFC